MLKGIGTTKSVGIGKALVVKTIEVEAKRHQITDAKAEIACFIDIRERFVNETLKLIDELKDRLGDSNKDVLVLKNQVYLAKDTFFEAEVKKRIEEQQMCVEAAIEEVSAIYTDLFSSMDNDDMKQRISDVSDMKNRMLMIHRNEEDIDLKHLPHNTVIVTKQLHPSMTARLDIANVAGIVSEKGGETSHAAILARALQIPAVLCVSDFADKVKNTDLIIVDGTTGEVFINPSNETIDVYEAKKAKLEKENLELKKYIDRDTVTLDGRKVLLAANIGSSREASWAMDAGAEGVGLFRTEFLFMNGVDIPSEEEQFNEYRKAAILLKGKTLTIRTLDIGGDKDIPYMGLVKEINPFLGYRAIRFCLDRIDIFTTQLRAILRASAFGKIRIMIPLVTCVDEIIQVREIISGIMKELDNEGIAYDKDIKVGIMIETPAAAVMADVLAKHADFFSIGTNDLIQYTVAVDRGNENVSYLYSVFNPSVLRLIKHVIDSGHKENIEVGMCGEAAANPCMIPLLIDMGLDEFSVSSGMILKVRKEIASWSFKETNILTKNALQLTTAKEVSEYLSGQINKEIRNR